MRRRIARVFRQRGVRRRSSSVVRRRRRPSTAPHRETTTTTKGRPNVRTSSSSDRARARKYLRERSSARASDRATRSICGAHRWRRRSRATVRIPPCAHTARRVDAAARSARARTDDRQTYPPHPSIAPMDAHPTIHRPRTATRDPRAHCLRTQNRRRTHAQISPSLSQKTRARVRAKISARASVGPAVLSPAVLSPTTKNIASANRDQAAESPDARDRCARMARSMRAIDGCARAIDARDRCARSMD